MANEVKLEKSKSEWQQQLSPIEYSVTREKGTERAFTGKYWDHNEEGIYRCVCCGTPLFASDTKFDAGVAGRVISRRSIRRMCAKSATRRTEWHVPKSSATYATHIWDKFFPTDHALPACATALILRHSSSNRSR